MIITEIETFIIVMKNKECIKVLRRSSRRDKGYHDQRSPKDLYHHQLYHSQLPHKVIVIQDTWMTTTITEKELNILMMNTIIEISTDRIKPDQKKTKFQVGRDLMIGNIGSNHQNLLEVKALDRSQTILINIEIQFHTFNQFNHYSCYNQIKYSIIFFIF